MSSNALPANTPQEQAGPLQTRVRQHGWQGGRLFDASADDLLEDALKSALAMYEYILGQPNATPTRGDRVLHTLVNKALDSMLVLDLEGLDEQKQK